MTHVDHAWRHRPKALGGTDPIEFTSGGVFTTYRDCVRADPSTLHLWPCDDASGNLADLVGGSDMTPSTHTVWPQYGKVGPFTGLPSQTAVENDNGNFTASLAGQAFFSGPQMPAGTSPFTIQGWVYKSGASFGGAVMQDWSGGGGQSIHLTISDTGVISFARAGASVSGGDVPEAVWTHVRVDYDGATIRLLQDFVVVDTQADVVSISAQGGWNFLNSKGISGNWNPWVGRAALWSLHDDVALDCPIEGDGGSSNAPAGYGPVADGSGGVAWSDIATQAELDTTQTAIDDHIADTTAAHTAAAIAITDAAADFTATDVEGALAELQTADEADEAALAAHLADAVDAHDASAVSIVDAGGYYTAAEVEAALQEIGADLATPARWELVMADGVTAPPVPVETEAQDDWVYALVED